MRTSKDPYRASDFFRRLASKTSHGVGSPWAFIVALGTVTVWALTGPVFHYSDTWQLAINTSTTIVTFLMVFLIQNTQNRDSHAIHLKLDELIRTNEAARNRLICLEELDDREIAELQHEFDKLAQEKLRERGRESSHPSHQAGTSRTSTRTTGARSSRGR